MEYYLSYGTEAGVSHLYYSAIAAVTEDSENVITDHCRMSEPWTQSPLKIPLQRQHSDSVNTSHLIHTTISSGSNDQC